MPKRLILLAPLLLAACSDADTARRVLAAQGYKDIEITGSRYWGCGDNEIYRTGFNAVSSQGIPVTGIVCQGPYKGASIRFD